MHKCNSNEEDKQLSLVEGQECKESFLKEKLVFEE